MSPHPLVLVDVEGGAIYSSQDRVFKDFHFVDSAFGEGPCFSAIKHYGSNDDVVDPQLGFSCYLVACECFM